MSIRTGRDIVHRWAGNPLIDIQDLSFPCSDVHNAGIVRMNGNVMMLVTIESRQGYTRIHRAASWDGINFTVDAKPFMDYSIRVSIFAARYLNRLNLLDINVSLSAFHNLNIL